MLTCLSVWEKMNKLYAWQWNIRQDLETGCPNRGFIDFWVSKVWNKVHTTNEINPICLGLKNVIDLIVLKF